jgi:hypothetical protein
VLAKKRLRISFVHCKQMPGEEILATGLVRCLCCVERGFNPKVCERNFRNWKKHHKTAHAACTCGKDEHALPPQPMFVYVDYVSKMADLQTQAISFFWYFVILFIISNTPQPRYSAAAQSQVKVDVIIR